jgi:hypothetical protein
MFVISGFKVFLPHNVDMNPFFFPRKEVKPVISNAKDRRAHNKIIEKSPYIVNQTFWRRRKENLSTGGWSTKAS